MGDQRLGLALGGGAARGFAHIGVLKALQERGMKPWCVAGTSVGSLVGALIASGAEWQEIKRAAATLQWKDMVSLSLPDRGLVSSKKMGEFLERLISASSIDDLKLPFGCVATDLQSGEAVTFTSGNLRTAVRASCSIPVIFEPLRYEERLLVDGGLVNEVPADVARSLGADYVIAVDLNDDRTTGKEPETVSQVLFKTINLLIAGTSQAGRGEADITIKPDLAGFGYANLNKLEEAIERGEMATIAALDSRQ